VTDTCVNCTTVNNFKNHILKELEPETCEKPETCLRVGVIGISLCLLMLSVSSDIGGFGEFGEYVYIHTFGLYYLY